MKEKINQLDSIHKLPIGKWDGKSGDRYYKGIFSIIEGQHVFNGYVKDSPRLWLRFIFWIARSVYKLFGGDPYFFIPYPHGFYKKNQRIWGYEYLLNEVYVLDDPKKFDGTTVPKESVTLYFH